MNAQTLPHIPYNGLIARVCMQCTCPDSGKVGTFLYSGETWRNKGSRVTPVFADLVALVQHCDMGGWQIIKDDSHPLGTYTFRA